MTPSFSDTEGVRQEQFDGFKPGRDRLIVGKLMLVGSRTYHAGEVLEDDAEAEFSERQIQTMVRTRYLRIDFGGKLGDAPRQAAPERPQPAPAPPVDPQPHGEPAPPVIPHGEPAPAPAAAVDPLACVECGKTFAKAVNLGAHKRSHKKKE